MVYKNINQEMIVDKEMSLSYFTYFLCLLTGFCFFFFSSDIKTE